MAKSTSQFERALVWIRRDLRLSDHRALAEATRAAKEVLLIFVIDEAITKSLKPDNRRVTFIQQSLDEMDQALQEKSSRLLVVTGAPEKIIPELCKEYGMNAVFYNRDYEPFALKRDEQVAKKLAKLAVKVFSYKDQVIFDRSEILNGSEGPYRVFTPYSKKWLAQFRAKQNELLEVHRPNFKTLISEKVLQGKKNAQFWDLGFQKQTLDFEPGERAGKKVLKQFVKTIQQYHALRDLPAVAGTSQLSVHLRFGTVSVREAMRFAIEHMASRQEISGAKTWLNELIWREFYQMVLFHFPNVVKESFKENCRDLKWQGTERHFKLWCEGKTGYPIVDAAMRQLNQTGWMHNRLRMIVAMFLTKDLLVDWKKGEQYFHEQLLDYELASNNGGWQWSASTGCDAQPYFRVMNPVTQSQRFDTDGSFIRKWIPELKNVMGKSIHWPHTDAGRVLGAEDYWDPLVDHSIQRKIAIEMFK